jgi:hypothetical protein
MKIFVATVSHRHGINAYAAKTRAGIQKQLADYCREWWDEAGLDPVAEGTADSDIIDAYFEICGDEFYNLDETKLED